MDLTEPVIALLLAMLLLAGVLATVLWRLRRVEQQMAVLLIAVEHVMNGETADAALTVQLARIFQGGAE